MGAKLTNVLFQNQIAPIGTIVAWAKGLAGVPSLPGTWAECDGSTVNGIVLPDLRNNAWLVGTTNYNATLLTEMSPRHTHTANRNLGSSSAAIGGADGPQTSTSGWINAPSPTGDTLRVVYIMRVG